MAETLDSLEERIKEAQKSAPQQSIVESTLRTRQNLVAAFVEGAVPYSTLLFQLIPNQFRTVRWPGLVTVETPDELLRVLKLSAPTLTRPIDIEGELSRWEGVQKVGLPAFLGVWYINIRRRSTRIFAIENSINLCQGLDPNSVRNYYLGKLISPDGNGVHLNGASRLSAGEMTWLKS